MTHIFTSSSLSVTILEHDTFYVFPNVCRGFLCLIQKSLEIFALWLVKVEDMRLRDDDDALFLAEVSKNCGLYHILMAKQTTDITHHDSSYLARLYTLCDSGKSRSLIDAKRTRGIFNGTILLLVLYVKNDIAFRPTIFSTECH